jgi:RNA polymerase sigma-70 factor (ECF subfamily)
VLINGAVGALSALEGRPFSLGSLTVREGRIVAIDIVADPERLATLDPALLP